MSTIHNRESFLYAKHQLGTAGQKWLDQYEQENDMAPFIEAIGQLLGRLFQTLNCSEAERAILVNDFIDILRRESVRQLSVSPTKTH